MVRTSLAVVSSTIILFVWGSLSWSLFPWHQPREFKDAAAVGEVIKAHTDGHGVYAYPSWKQGEGRTPADMEKEWAEGPYIWATVRPGSRPDLDIGGIMLRQVGIVLLASVTLLFLIQKSKHNAFLDRLSIAVLAGLLTGILSALPQWNWLETPGRETLAFFFDGIISITLAGAAIALILPKRAA